jgi:hypothetical protein
MTTMNILTGAAAATLGKIENLYISAATAKPEHTHKCRSPTLIIVTRTENSELSQMKRKQRRRIAKSAKAKRVDARVYREYQLRF